GELGASDLDPSIEPCPCGVAFGQLARMRVGVDEHRTCAAQPHGLEPDVADPAPELEERIAGVDQRGHPLALQHGPGPRLEDAVVVADREPAEAHRARHAGLPTPTGPSAYAGSSTRSATRSRWMPW